MQQTTMIPNSGIMSVPRATANYAASTSTIIRVSSGEAVRNISLRAGYIMYVYSGGWAYNTTATGSKTIVNGSSSVGYAALIASSGAKISGARVSSFAYLSAKAAEIDYAWAYDGGKVVLTNNTSGAKLSATDSGMITIDNTSFVSRCVAASGGVIRNEGEIIDAILSSGGSMSVAGSDYTAYVTHVFISRGGVVSGLSNSYLSNVYCTGTLNLYSSTCTARDVYVYGGGNMTLYGRANALRVTVKKFGALNGFTRLSEEYYDSCNFNGLYHEDTYVSSGVTALLNYSAHSAFNTDVRGGGVMRVDQGVATYTRVAAGGAVIVGSGGVASRTTLNGNATAVTTMTVSSGGMAENVTLSNAAMTVEGVASNVSVKSGGEMFIASGGSAYSAWVESSARLEIAERGSVGYLSIDANGVLNGFTYRKDTFLQNAGKINDYVSTKVVGDVVLSSGCTAADTIIEDQGKLTVQSGAKITGPLEIKNASVKVEAGGIVDLNITNQNPGGTALIVNWYNLYFDSLADALTLTVNPTAQNAGLYTLATDFYTKPKDIVISVVDTGNNKLGTLTVENTVEQGGRNFSLYVENNQLLLSVTEVAQSKPASDLLSNGYSQIVAWDASQGNVGYVAVNGAIPPDWRGIWEWPQDEAAMWKVVGVGRFSGSSVEQDGILLYNGYGNTFAAWTNLNDPSYGYVSLCHVDGNFATKSLVNLDGNEFDDVLIYDDKGSFGVVIDAAEYHDIWHVDNPSTNVQQLIGAGNFGAADGKDSLLVKKTDENAYFLWHNNDPSFNSWDWSQTYIGSLDNDWSVAGIGDFSGDGIDDIAMWRKSTGEIQIWEDGKASDQRYAGSLDQAAWEVAAVGDYNGDGMEDLLLREQATGWGGLGYWASADANKWTDMNARVETDMESRFAIIA